MRKNSQLQTKKMFLTLHPMSTNTFANFQWIIHQSVLQTSADLIFSNKVLPDARKAMITFANVYFWIEGDYLKSHNFVPNCSVFGYIQRQKGVQNMHDETLALFLSFRFSWD